MKEIKEGDILLLPKDSTLTPFGLEKEMPNVELVEYRVIELYSEEGVDRIVLKRMSGKIHYIRYLEDVMKMLETIKQWSNKLKEVENEQRNQI